MTERISGIIAPITTPFVDEAVSIDQLKGNVRKYRDTPLSGFFVLGSNGENKSLTEAEKLKILEAVLGERSDHQLIMAGTGYESTRQAIAFSKKAADLGADFVSLLTPSYFKKRLTDEAMIGYYTEVAEALSIPVPPPLTQIFQKQINGRAMFGNTQEFLHVGFRLSRKKSNRKKTRKPRL